MVIQASSQPSKLTIHSILAELFFIHSEDSSDEGPSDEGPSDEDPSDEDPSDEDPSDEDPSDEDPSAEDSSDIKFIQYKTTTEIKSLKVYTLEKQDNLGQCLPQSMTFTSFERFFQVLESNSKGTRGMSRKDW